MSNTVLYHNPGCSKSRGALAILRERGVDFEVIEYLEQPLDRASLERLLNLLPGPAAELLRTDAHFRELGLDASAYGAPDAVVGLLLEHPRLMQRPILVRGDRAVIARPSEKVLELL
jgi:arsenate reductase